MAHLGPFQFNPEVSFGNLLTLVGIVWVLVQKVGAARKELLARFAAIEAHEKRFTGIETAQSLLRARGDRQAKSMQDLKHQIDLISAKLGVPVGPQGWDPDAQEHEA